MRVSIARIMVKILSLALLITANASHAADKWALLVGINNYDISPLRYCVADVEAFRKTLIDPDIGGFDSGKVYLMTDKNIGLFEPTLVNIIRVLGALAGMVKPEDTFVFYFSGHGVTLNGRSFLQAVDSDPRSFDTMEVTGVPLDKVSEILSRMKARQVLSVIDACRRDPQLVGVKRIIC